MKKSELRQIIREEIQKLNEGKGAKLTYLWLTYDDRRGDLYSATFKYSDRKEVRLRGWGSDLIEVEKRIKDAYGIDAKVGHMSYMTHSEDKLRELSKKLKIDFTVYDHDLS